jgi:hypothetical protein
MMDLFDPRSFGPPHGDWRALAPYRHHRPRIIDLFDEGSFGPQPGDRHLSALRRHLEWISRHEWPARIVIVTGEIAAAYLCVIATDFGFQPGILVAPVIENDGNF